MRPGAFSLFAVVCLSVPRLAAAQVVRARAPVVPAISIFTPLSSPVTLPILNSGLPSSPQLSPLISPSLLSAPTPLTSPVAPISAVTAAIPLSIHAVAPKAIRAAAIPSVSPILAAVKAAKPPPPQAAPGMDPSASALFDGIAVRSSPSAGDPVFPGDETPSSPRESSSPRRVPRLVHPNARSPITPHRLAPEHSPGDGHHHDDLPSPPSTPAHEKALKLAMAVSLMFIAVELLGGFLTHSAALQADAVHLLSDQLINGAALFSAWLSRRTPGGYPRVEAFVGFLAAGVIGWTGVELGLEAYSRFLVPGAAATWSVAAFALASLASNLSAALILRRHHGSSLGVKSAFLVALTDTVGSIGVIVSTAAAILFGWGWTEAVVTALIGAMIVKISWGLGKPAFKALFARQRGV